ncbi:MAG: hypothetical protein EXR72_21115 [Myxococcales bacterium]|nr:hypothetical protein [Myxococcales bacterium]
MKAREFLAHRVGEAVVVRNLIKEPLGVEELKKLVAKVGSARELVAPKRRGEAAAVPDGELVEWLAADGGRVRRPIVVAGKKVTLGFSAAIAAELEAALG